MYDVSPAHVVWTNINLNLTFLYMKNLIMRRVKWIHTICGLPRSQSITVGGSKLTSLESGLDTDNTSCASKGSLPTRCQQGGCRGD